MNLLPYRDKALKLMGLFDSITLNHVGRTGNDRADVLATLASRLVMPDGKIYNSIRIIRRDHPSRFEVGSSSANSQRLSTNAEVETKTAGSGGSFSQYPISLRFSVLHAFQKRDFLAFNISSSQNFSGFGPPCTLEWECSHQFVFQHSHMFQEVVF